MRCGDMFYGYEGTGEEFMRHVAAYDISCRMEYGSCSLPDAVCGLVHRRLPPDSGGVIAVDSTGALCLEFNTPGMMRGWVTHDGVGGVGIWGETKTVLHASVETIGRKERS